MGQDEINILIIEDDATTASFLEETLKQTGLTAWIADTPKQGFELAREISFSVALTELRGRMNGVEVTREMAKISPMTNVLVITVFSLISTAVEAMEAGAYGFITKPFNPAEVKIVVKRAVEHFLLRSSQEDNKDFAELSVKDGLTGLYNYRYFKVCLADQLARAKQEKESFSLGMLDLDNFKKYNDTHGHPAGDILLRRLAKVLQQSVRDGDLVFRYGGEEFVAIFSQADKKSVPVIAQRMCTLVSLYTEGTVSIGVSTFPDDGTDAQILIDKADSALYEAKNRGKNQVRIA